MTNGSRNKGRRLARSKSTTMSATVMDGVSGGRLNRHWAVGATRTWSCVPNSRKMLARDQQKGRRPARSIRQEPHAPPAHDARLHPVGWDPGSTLGQIPQGLFHELAGRGFPAFGGAHVDAGQGNTEVQADLDHGSEGGLDPHEPLTWWIDDRAGDDRDEARCGPFPGYGVRHLPEGASKGSLFAGDSDRSRDNTAKDAGCS